LAFRSPETPRGDARALTPLKVICTLWVTIYFYILISPLPTHTLHFTFKVSKPLKLLGKGDLAGKIGEGASFSECSYAQ
jgi:hypothetical protein